MNDTNPNTQHVIKNPIRRTITCTACGNVTRMWQGGVPTMAGPACIPKFCPICGAGGEVGSGILKVRVGRDSELDYWEVLAETYGYPVSVIQAVYDAWNPAEHRNFGDFINALREENAQAREQNLNSDPAPSPVEHK